MLNPVLPLIGDKVGDHVFTPERVAIKVVEMLPDSVWNKNTMFLDIACKSGVFLLAILDKLMHTESLIRDFPNERVRREHILTKQLFGLAMDEYTQALSSRALYGRMGINWNIRYIDGYSIRVKTMTDKEFKETIEREFNGVKFDVVVGNPPYQKGTRSIYQYFVNKALALNSNHTIMIVKNNWLNSDTLKQTRDNILKSGLKRIVNYPVVGDVFKSVKVMVCIFYAESGYTGNVAFEELVDNKACSKYSVNFRNLPIIFRNSIECSIYSKLVPDLVGGGSFEREVYNPLCFGITSTLSSRNGYELDVSVLETDQYNIKVAYMDGRSLDYMYIQEDDIPARKELVEYYKVICGEKLTKNSKVLTNINILDKGTAYTGSWGMLYASKDLSKACNVAAYAKTRFFRFLVSLLCDAHMTALSPYRFSLIPSQDFSHPWTDKMLYKKYSLTQEEIGYIESTIKPVK